MGISGVMLVVDEPFCCHIKLIETTFSANPEYTSPVSINCPNRIVTQAVRIIRVVQVFLSNQKVSTF